MRNEYNRREISELIKSHSFKEIFVDVNLREPFISRESLMLCMENATVLKISDEELSAVSKILYNTEYDYKNIATEISKTFQNIKFIIITLGEKGSYAYDVFNKASFSCDAERVTVASTVGAGDSFSAAFLYKYMSGFDINSCLKTASRISAYVVSKTEAVPEYDQDILLKNTV